VIRWHPGGGHHGDRELALEFDDVARAAVAAAQLLSPEQREQVAALDEQLATMSDQAQAGLWSRAELEAAPAWTIVRARARAALDAFHVEPIAHADVPTSSPGP